ncbi:MAG: threonine ammonia-lyase, biosynthetic [Gammaproteobacteria bacterium]|nr:threonine ammonia-lyase, biosynthetic [Gammaproteobacteria bacterium]
MPPNYLQKILNARVYDVAERTPLQYAEKLSARYHNRIWLKREDLQPVFSFKLRGAYNKIYQLMQQQKVEKVVSASAGNHAQGVALAAQRLGIKAIIVMPKTTPPIKVEAVRALGARIELVGDTYDEAYEYSLTLVEKENASYIHPYDDPDVIAGQGTIGMEILQQHKTGPDMVFVPVGGGGLLAGVCAYIKALRPHIKVIGVESEDSACLAAAMRAGKRVRLSQVGLFADGVAVREIGKEPFRVVHKILDDVILVNTDEICAAIKDVFDASRSIAEPAGALALAGLKKYVQQHDIKNQELVAIVSGANMNFDRLRHVSERAELGEHREMLMAVKVPERPGSFRAFCRALGKRSITEFNYRYADAEKAYIFAGIELARGPDEQAELLARLANKGFEVVDMTDNEMAKMHIRYMVGGRPQNLQDELILRLEFPERPGALMTFLDSIGQAWNITLFHYRNHGAAYGRVLVGLQIPNSERAQLHKSLRALGYDYHEESSNPAYQLFLG